MVSVKTNFSPYDNLYLQLLPSTSIATSAPPQIIGIRFSKRARNLDPSRAQFTVGFVLLCESNSAADLTRGRAQAVMQVMRSSCKYK